MTIPVEHQRVHPDVGTFPPSPPKGPTFLAPQANHHPVPHGRFEPMQMPIPLHDCPPHLRGPPTEEGLLLPFSFPHIPYSGYPSSEFGTYFPTHPPEHFVDYSFRFDPYLSNQGGPRYPITLGNVPIPSNFYSHPPPPQFPHPQHRGHMSDMRPQPSFEHQPLQPPIHFYYPSPPQMFLAPTNPSVGEMPAIEKHNNHNPPTVKNLVSPSASSNRRKVSPDRSLRTKQAHTASSLNLKHANSTIIDVHRPIHRNNNAWPMSYRSLLLEDFRNNHHKNWELKSIFGHIIEFSGDQHGSRFIQQQLEGASDWEKQQVFEEIAQSSTNELIRDVFGNYVIQKFFEFGTQLQKDILVKVVEEQVFSLSLHIYGCRVVQKALEFISADQQSSMIRCLDSHILTCIKDAHGNHVVQKLIEVVPSERLTFLSIICENILELSTHPYGCRVLQRCLEHLPLESTRPLLEAILRFTLDLTRNQYGNYVIQFIIEFGQENDKAAILASIQGNLIELSQHKYASNVCEKALVCGNSGSRQRLIDEILVPKLPNGGNPILTMVKDQYANYVLQRALTLSEGQQRDVFFNLVKPNLVQLRKVTTSYSRPLVSLERLMDKYFGKLPSLGQKTPNSQPTSTANTVPPRRSL